MASFYVDYENVHNGGTEGINQLSNREYVFLFYSHNANTMNMETVKKFMESRCGIEFIEAETGTANALDFQLVAFLFTGTNQDDYHYIISKDRGFDSAIRMGNKEGINNVKRFTTINEAYKDYVQYLEEVEKTEGNENTTEEVYKNTVDEDIRDTICKVDKTKYRTIIIERIKKLVQKGSNITLPREELEIVYEGIANCENKMRLYHFLRKQLGDKRGRCVYENINKDFMQIRTEWLECMERKMQK